MVLETHVKLCVTEPDIPEKKILALKMGQKWVKTMPFLFFLKSLVINLEYIV